MIKMNMDSSSTSVLVEKVTVAMIDAFRDEFLRKENEEVIKKDYSLMVESILSSISATMIHMWADGVLERGDDIEQYTKIYGDAVHKMLLHVGQNVLDTYGAKMQMLQNKIEVH